MNIIKINHSREYKTLSTIIIKIYNNIIDFYYYILSSRCRRVNNTSYRIINIFY